MDNLKGCECLACASSHDYENTLATCGNSLYCTVNGYALIVARLVAVCVIVVWCFYYF